MAWAIEKVTLQTMTKKQQFWIMILLFPMYIGFKIQQGFMYLLGIIKK